MSDGILPVEVAYKVKDLVDSLETITFYKHHYVRKTGLKHAIKQLIYEIITETEQIQILDDWLIKGKYSDQRGSRKADETP